MAWRIDEQVIRGEIDNRQRGRVTGRIWLVGRDGPVELDLEGNCWRDLAGHRLKFTNPNPKLEGPEGLAGEQEGVVGDITASRKVKVPECTKEEFEELYLAKKPFPWHWGNALYLEWFSQRNGRVVIESTDYTLELDPEPAWEMTEAEEEQQRVANATALTDFMDRLVSGVGKARRGGEDFDDDEPQSAAEAEAEAETARMNLLIDRVSARMDRDGRDEDDFEKIYFEERERLRKERGEPPEPELTPEQEAERERWIEEMNAAAEEAMTELESEKWKGEDPFEREEHPLARRCRDFSVRICKETEEGGWIPDDAQREHPLVEIVNGAMSASAKLAGALNGRGEWPPEALFAGDSLVRLKKAREYLRDAIRGLDSADEEKLAPAPWRASVRREISEILGEVQTLIREVRGLLADEENTGE